MKKNKEGQQEIVGFVLIVVLVMVGLMVFLVISVRNGTEDEGSSVAVSNMLDVILRTTSECAIVYEPDYDRVEDLFKSCFKGSSCSNLGESACNYLDDYLDDVVSSITLSDASILGWSVDFFEKDGAGISQWKGGEACNGSVNGAQRAIISGGTSLVVRIRVCG